VISLDEVKRKAAQAGVGVDTIEIDYVLGWFLWGLSQNNVLKECFIFKGGTALRKVYLKADFRYSEDLDFTMSKALREEMLAEELKASCVRISRQTGMELRLGRFKKSRAQIGEEAYRAKISFVGPQRRSNVRWPNLDITRYEILVLEPRELPVFHPYSDNMKANVLTYPLEEILAEKLRTLLTRPWARHFYDVWYLFKSHADKIDLNEAIEVFHRKREYKGIQFSGVSDFLDSSRLATAKGGWNASLRNVMRDIPPFDQVVNEMRIFLESLFA